MTKDDDQIKARKKAAQSLAQALLRDVKISAIPVSLRMIIEHLQNERGLDVISTPDLSERVSGLLITIKNVDEEYATIVFNENHPWCRRRFTIAHEIGHMLLGHTCEADNLEGKVNEKEANIFAAELLVPLDLLKKDYQILKDIPSLASKYLVSEQAMSIRLMETRLVC